MAPPTINKIDKVDGSGTGETLMLSIPLSVVSVKVTLARFVQFTVSCVAVVRPVNVRVIGAPPPNGVPTRVISVEELVAKLSRPRSRLIRLKAELSFALKVIVLPLAQPKKEVGSPGMVTPLELPGANTALSPVLG